MYKIYKVIWRLPDADSAETKYFHYEADALVFIRSMEEGLKSKSVDPKDPLVAYPYLREVSVIDKGE